MKTGKSPGPREAARWPQERAYGKVLLFLSITTNAPSPEGEKDAATITDSNCFSRRVRGERKLSFIAVFATSINDQVEQAGTKLPTVLIIDHDSREGYIR